ncbi:MAG: hypothetical protein JO257_14475 [Deltaproteobacteria bacterium]|nr:hypothetical protein [Deltaproteobacteria bacterium]
MLRTLAVVAFIGLVAAGALYAAQRKTIARGSVLAADIVAANPTTVRTMECDDTVEIGIAGATFSCRAEFMNGLVEQLQMTLDRSGAIHQGSGD